MLSIVVNDRPQEVPVGCTIAQLLERLEITTPAVAVELNLEIQPHHQFEATQLQNHDKLEIVTLVGGG